MCKYCDFITRINYCSIYMIYLELHKIYYINKSLCNPKYVITINAKLL